MRGRSWCFTDNNYLGLIDFDALGASWLVYQEEVGDSGTPHLQGVLGFASVKSFAQVQAALPEGAHIEQCHKLKESIAYCQKDDSRVGGPYIHGSLPQQGSRSDLIAVKRCIDDGGSINDVAEEHFSDFVRYHKGITMYKRMKSVKRSWAMSIIVYVGPTGTGKTRAARDTYPDAYWKPKGKWWDNYSGEDTVVIDEMYGGCFSYSELLMLLDRYPYSVETKGGTVEFVSKRVIMTSNQEPEDWYPSEKTHNMEWKDSPLNRRLKEFGVIIRTGEVHRRIVPPLMQQQLYGGSFQ